MDEKLARQEICRIGKLLYDKGMIAGMEGNISVRLIEDPILITPAGRCKGDLKPQDTVKLEMSGEVVGGGKPSSEFRLHLAAYHKRPNFKAAVHAHAPHLSAFASKSLKLAGAEQIPEFVATFGDIPLVPFAPPGSRELGENLCRVIADAHTFLLDRHGAIAFGSTLDEAFYRLEMAEQLAKTLLLANLLPGRGAAV